MTDDNKLAEWGGVKVVLPESLKERVVEKPKSLANQEVVKPKKKSLFKRLFGKKEKE